MAIGDYQWTWGTDPVYGADDPGRLEAPIEAATQGQWGFAGGTPGLGGAFLSDQDLSDVPMDRLYRMAAGAAMPGFQRRPYQEAALARMQSPLMGQYAMAYPTYGTTGETGEELGFQDWLMSGATTPGETRFSGGVSPNIADWRQMIGVARDPEGVTYAPGSEAHERWYGQGPLGYEDSLRNLIGLATYDPRAGSLYGRMRQAGRARAKERWQMANPLATDVDWLGYLTREGGLAAPGYTV